MALTAKQEAFCQAIADGKTQADAYRSAYNCVNMKDSSVWEKASELMSDVKVTSRVKELRDSLAAKSLWSRERSVIRLAKIADESDSNTEAIAAVKELNAMHGFNAPTKSELTVKGGLVLIPGKNGDSN